MSGELNVSVKALQGGEVIVHREVSSQKRPVGVVALLMLASAKWMFLLPGRFFPLTISVLKSN